MDVAGRESVISEECNWAPREVPQCVLLYYVSGGMWLSQLCVAVFCYVKWC